MNNVKLILPMLAFVLAIGMSFAFTSEAPGDLVIEIDGIHYQSPINCNGNGEECTALISKGGNILEVQVKRETTEGTYVPEETAETSNIVYQFSSLTPINP